MRSAKPGTTDEHVHANVVEGQTYAVQVAAVKGVEAAYHLDIDIVAPPSTVTLSSLLQAHSLLDTP